MLSSLIMKCTQIDNVYKTCFIIKNTNSFPLHFITITLNRQSRMRADKKAHASSLYDQDLLCHYNQANSVAPVHGGGARDTV
jgi:hypothetical protein